MAMATARLACCCPMMYLSSSATIWRGVSLSIFRLQLLDRNPIVGVDTQPGGDPHPLLHDLAGREGGVFHQRPGRSRGVPPPGPDADDPVVRLNHVAGP